MSYRSRSLVHALIAAAALTAAPGCQGATDPGAPAAVRTFRITGVTVQPLDRIDGKGITRFVFADTLRGQIAFNVTTHAEVLPDEGSAPAASSADPFPGHIANPVLFEKRWLSVDRPVRHRGVEIPAHANLLAVEAVRTSFNGTRSDLLFGLLTPFAVGQVHVRTDAFELAPGWHEFTFRWETADGELFSDVVPVYLDLTSR